MKRSADSATTLGMKEQTWRRHANPWSVRTRLATVPFIVLAAYSWTWIGWWALAPGAAIALWLWLNVLVFPPVDEPVRWESRAIFGEKIWLASKARDLPQPELGRARAPLVASFAAVALAAYGIIFLQPVAAAAGAAGVIAGQIWFLDSLARLFDAVDSRPLG